MKKSTDFLRANGETAVVLGVACVVTVAILIAARELSPSADMPIEAQPQNATAVMAMRRTAADPEQPLHSAAPVETTAKTAPVDVAAKTAPMEARAKKVPATRTEPSKVLAANPLPAETLMASSTVANPTESVVVQDPAEVTITGCLEHDDEKFRLKDTTGADAPRSRSWKAGFLKKRPASLEVVDTANTLRLPNHVGQRLSVTGVLVDREMQAYSVRRVAAC